MRAEAAPEEMLQKRRDRRERVHILTGAICNNNCIFCMEEDREGRYRVNSATDDARVRFILEQNPGAEEICFTSGEPTTNPALGRWVRMAKESGAERISVMTNGRALSYARYAKALIGAGLRRFYISIHGHDQKLHEGLTRTPKSFEQTVAGLRMIASLKKHPKARGLELHTSTVITKRNLPHLGEIYRFLRGLGVDQVVFNVMQANGRADTHFEKIFPRYTEIADEARRFFAEQGKHEREVMAFLVDIPLCTTEGIPDLNRGYVERYKHYEPALNGSHDQVLAPELAASDLLRADLLGADLLGPDLSRPGQASDSEALVQIRRADLDDAARTKREECKNCRFFFDCEGVWSNYLRRYGWDEMIPVSGPREPRGGPAA